MRYHCKQMATTDVAKLASAAVSRRERMDELQRQQAELNAEFQREQDAHQRALLTVEAVLVFLLTLCLKELGFCIGCVFQAGIIGIFYWFDGPGKGRLYVAHTLGCALLAALGVVLSYKLNIKI